MEKIITVSCIGCGQRGYIYLNEMQKLDDGKKYKIISICDLKKDRLDYFKKEFGVSDDNAFFDEDDFFANMKADLCVVATQDQDHVGHAIKAIKAGCDVLCEKPISNREDEVRRLLSVQQQYNKKVFVCHVLRYAPAFREVKRVIDSGILGEIVTIDNIENVHYAHQAHSYVRGNWRNSDETSPMIIAKCCHDLDLFVWMTGSECDSVSSFGDLRFFKKENQPKGAANRCKDCSIQENCVFDAYRIYIQNHFWGRSCITDERPVTDEAVKRALDNGPYGRCVFDCDNNVVDNQVSILRFKNGVTATLRMTAFTAQGGRILKVYGTHGEVDLDESRGVVIIKEFGKDFITKPISTLVDATSGHGGGDSGLIKSLYNFLMGYNDGNATSLSASVESHLIGFALEESRLQNGQLIKIIH